MLLTVLYNSTPLGALESFDMTYDQWMEFLGAAGACLLMVTIVASVGISSSVDVTALTSRSKKIRGLAAADLVVTGGDGIFVFYIWRWWRRRMRRKG